VEECVDLDVRDVELGRKLGGEPRLPASAGPDDRDACQGVNGADETPLFSE
jgi:hypothetical protein